LVSKLIGYLLLHNGLGAFGSHPLGFEETSLYNYISRGYYDKIYHSIREVEG